MTFDDFSKLTDTKHARVIKSIIGISRLKFDILANAFAETHSAIQHERCTSKKIKRVQSGGSKGNLDSPEKKLFFTLFYLKTYPTFDVLGFHFGFSSGHAHNHLKNLLPVLLQSLLSLGVLPVRTVGCPEEFTQLIEKYEDIAIDGLECACVRPLDKELQKARYSGKKKRHTLKALAVTSLQRKIICLFFFVSGSIHDYTLMKTIFDPKFGWFNKIRVWLDLGFLGAENDYGNKSNIKLPHKKSRKSKANPEPKFTKSQEEHNLKHARTRVIVEHAIGGMKSFYCLTHRIRNHLDQIIEYLFWIPAGLWNLKIS